MRIVIDLEGWRIEGENGMLEWLESERKLEEFEGNIQIIFIGDEEIAYLNRTYLGHDGPTDVIAFNLEEPGETEAFTFQTTPGDLALDPDEDIAGEIYVSLHRAVFQAHEYRVTPEEEIGRLALHGLLHLAGWRDDDDHKRGKMRLREDQGLRRAMTSNSGVPWRFFPPSSTEGQK